MLKINNLQKKTKSEKKNKNKIKFKLYIEWIIKRLH